MNEGVSRDTEEVDYRDEISSAASKLAPLCWELQLNFTLAHIQVGSPGLVFPRRHGLSETSETQKGDRINQPHIHPSAARVVEATVTAQTPRQACGFLHWLLHDHHLCC